MASEDYLPFVGPEEAQLRQKGRSFDIAPSSSNHGTHLCCDKVGAGTVLGEDTRVTGE
jgi:hypothetical protein